jgi:hypothetical protein
MDELDYVRTFRTAVPAGERDRARTALLDAIAAEAPGLRQRRLRLGLLLAVVAITGVAVGSALGVGDRLVELIAGKPAPPPIAARLRDEVLAKRIMPLFADVPNVSTKGAHGVVAIETRGGPVALWTVPTRDGPICYLVEFVRLSEREGSPHGDSRCMPHPSPDAPIVWTSTNEQVDGQELHVLAGPVDPVVASVWLRSPDGGLRRVAQAEDFFLLALPDLDEGDRLIVRDAAGRDLRAFEITPFMAGMFDGYDRKVTGPPRTVIDTTDSRGRPLRLLLQPGQDGKTCVIIQAVGRGSTCPPADKLRASSGIAVYPTLEGSIIYLSGTVGPEVSQLTLRYENGEQVEVPIVERFVLYDIARAYFNDGARPIELIGRNSEGVEVARQKVDQGVFGPKSSIWLPGDVSP